MRKLIFKIGIFFLLLPGISPGQVSLPHYPDSLFSTYYLQRVSHFRTLPNTRNDIIFLGNSITDGAEWSELFQDSHIKNRGISGDVTIGVLSRIDDIVNRKPSKVFLLIGINDLARGVPADSVYKNILKIVSIIHQYSPFTKVYVQSILPVNDHFQKFPTHVNKGKQIITINQWLQKSALADHYTFINLYSFFCDSTGRLRTNYTNDGLHLKGPGYMLWKHLIYADVYDLNQKPSLVPLPQSVKWTNDLFPLYTCHTITISDNKLTTSAERLQKMLTNIGWHDTLKTILPSNPDPAIELKLDSISAPQHPDEAYYVEVTDNRVIIKANTLHGIFDALQTFRQLIRDHDMIRGCRIKDWPSFSWRGYMVDVGRNYQPVSLLKQQIDVMSHYKLNVFHLHLTENIAWRLAIKGFPQLTAPDNMLRDQGEFYTESQLKSLIRYCKQRYIILVPEIDMPGHSDAFTRAFGVNMQSAKGMNILEKILTIFDSTYQVPYLHIGADEVHITNQEFIPTVTSMIHRQGKQTIGWAPGGNYGKNTIRQLWKDEPITNPETYYIDSRQLYLNHMDPEESVVSIFERQLDNSNKGTRHLLGGEICLWNDRAVANYHDLLKMNPVYPAMLAFAERAWRGGGYPGIVAYIGQSGSEKANAFKEFESRLIDQKKEFFKHLPFPYVRQADIKWKLFGPFANNGNLDSRFWPEMNLLSDGDSVADKIAEGATIYLRHWWFPDVQGWLTHPLTNTTWYAYRKFWYPDSSIGYLWIGFNNLSRSMATNSPEEGSWDNRKSELWLNGHLVPSPHWVHEGMKGNEEIPLVDEGYSYREPTQVHFKKGWNYLLVKTPVANFEGTDWQNPVKWMFTVVTVHQEYGKNWYADNNKN